MNQKLVRDNIPEIIRASGQLPVIHTAEHAEYRTFLRKKLLEETEEYLSSTDDLERLEELADILEVVRALAAYQGATWTDLQRAQLEKAEEKGAFTKRLIWSGNVT
jgi:predicted house-cleaning noncanonical NTP pyrophosphatase (MazG superfamily)